MTSIFQQAVTSLYRLGRYLKQHPVGVVVFLAFLFFAGYEYHVNVQDQHEVYDTTRLEKDTQGQQYTIEIYSGNGQLISRQHSIGLDISVSNTGNLSGGRRALIDTVVIHNGPDEMEVSGSTIVAFPSKDENLVRQSDCHKDNGQPIINSIIKRVPPDKRYGSKILLVKTYNEAPIYAAYGKGAKSFYSNIDNTQVFKLDGDPLFVFRGEFSISDATIFSD